MLRVKDFNIFCRHFFAVGSDDVLFERDSVTDYHYRNAE